MEGLSTELDFALRSRDPYPINLESLVDLLKYKHISSLTTHLKRHFQRDIDYKKFHQVRNKRQICVYYISVDCFKQICGFCRHTQRKEIAQNLLGTMGTDVKTTTADEMSFTDMLNNISELNHGDDSEEEDDFRMRQSSPPSKSIKTEKGSFVTKESLFNRYGRTQLQNNIAMMKRSGSFAETTPTPSFSNNIYNFNNLSAAHSITPIIPTPVPVISNKSTLTSSLAAPSFPSFNNPANALANAAISNTNNSAFAVNNNSNNTFNFNTPYPNFSFAPTTANNSYFSPSTTSISSFSSNAATSHLNPVTNINTITPTNTVPITISNNNFTNNFTSPTFSTTLSSSTFSNNNFSQDLLNTIPVTAIPTQQVNNHKRTSSSRTSPTPITTTPSLSTSSIKPITHVTSTITPTPIITSSTSLANSTTIPITTPITATPIINTATTPSPFIIPTSPATIRNTTTTTTTTVKPPVSPSMSKATILTPPPKPGVTKFFDFGNFTAKNNTYVNSFKNEPEFKVETDSSLFDLGLTACPDMQFYDDYLTLSSSPTSMFDPVNTLAEVDKIYEQWEQERGGPRLFDEYK